MGAPRHSRPSLTASGRLGPTIGSVLLDSLSAALQAHPPLRGGRIRTKGCEGVTLPAATTRAMSGRRCLLASSLPASRARLPGWCQWWWLLPGLRPGSWLPAWLLAGARVWPWPWLDRPCVLWPLAREPIKNGGEKTMPKTLRISDVTGGKLFYYV